MNKKNRLYRRCGKRFFELVVTVPALIVLAPVMAVIAIFVLINMGSPVFFCQMRPTW